MSGLRWDVVTEKPLANMSGLPHIHSQIALKTFGISRIDLALDEQRRLNTSIHNAKPPHFILTTEWLWYWKDDDGRWVKYGHEADGEKLTSVSSQTLENVYLAERETEIRFSDAKHKYILYFKEMYQQNVNYKTKREVRRRPCFVSAREVEVMLESMSSETSSPSSSAEAVPTH